MIDLELESDLKKQVLKYLQERMNKVGDIYFYKSECGNLSLGGRHFKTGKKGCPEITLCYKGRYVGIELKTKKGKQQDEQKEAEQRIIKAGGIYCLARNIKDILQIFD